MRILFVLLTDLSYISYYRANGSSGTENTNLFHWEIFLIGIMFFLFCGYIIYRIKRTKNYNCFSVRKLGKSPKMAKNVYVEQKLHQKDPKKQSQKTEEMIEDYESKIKNIEQRLSELESSYNNLIQHIKNIENCNNDITYNGKDKSNINQSSPIKTESKKSYNLTVQDGKLIEANTEQAIYYKMWNEGNKNFFVFVNNERTKKAINNRTIIIEPFCDEVNSSKDPDKSNFVDVCKPGVITNNFTVVEKIKIQYR